MGTRASLGSLEERTILQYSGIELRDSLLHQLRYSGFICTISDFMIINIHGYRRISKLREVSV
jgi:hypothetical protein